MRASGTVTHNQFQLLTDEHLVAVRSEKTVWRPAESRVAWKPLGAVPAPAKTAPRRLAQMRVIARKFSGHVFDVHADGGRIELRLMSSPLYRYENTDVLAHIYGFFAGVGFGYMHFHVTAKRALTWRTQTTLGIASVAIVLGAWYAAYVAW